MADKDTIDLHAQLDECEQVIAGLENESASDPAVQEKLKRCVAKLEEVTRRVSSLAMFSPNEHFDELATGHLRFLLLPAYLGQATQNLQSDDRSELLENAEVYFKDFLTRLHGYGIIDQRLPWVTDYLEENESSATSVPKTRSADPKGIREQKIKRFQQQKELELSLESLRKKRALDKEQDDETARDLYLTLLRLHALKAFNELDEIDKERPMLEHMAKIKSGALGDEATSTSSSKPNINRLKPVIITRDSMQKEVYGLGYPSLPTLTVDEWYQSMVNGGRFPKPGAPKVAAPVRTEDDSDEERETREEREEDADQLRSARALDEYKDDHRRGWGNRHNKG
uniref:TAP42-like protein n=1 Tax=Plectus sambesii TaxID=2011161 RepID=A0A914VXC3_9BILA